MPKKSKKVASRPAKLSWDTQALQIMNDILRRGRVSRACLFVLSSNGDLVLQAGSCKGLDFTSIGALAAAAEGVKRQLSALLSSKTESINFGDEKSGFWMRNINSWFVVGVRLPTKTKGLDNFYKHLKKKRPEEHSKHSRQNTAEALDGLSGEAVEAAFNKD
ncbi:MAG: hypothetical protein COV44_09090 [Deltaproteobacteria bacterium CG11_big_fil_rev_8_21_14_0_20_45_16]|nr:MAG: hypothetical protein COV44_09090 [Deltaproteobacteria bacterium CG11_big_fil_rev_8_21_14_0_20_45_16]